MGIRLKHFQAPVQRLGCQLAVLCCGVILCLNANAKDESTADTKADANESSFWSFDWFKKEPLIVTVNDAFLNLHMGPNSGSPIFHVVERGEKITLLKERTDWIKVKTARGITGWIQRNDIFLTLSPDGNVPDFPDYNKTDYLVDRAEFSTLAGDFAGARGINFNWGYRFTRNLATELRFAEHTGEFADSRSLAIGFTHQPFPEWFISPYFGIAAGKIRTFPISTLVKSEDRTDNLYQANLGAYMHITNRFYLRFEGTNNYILTRRNLNEEVKEWKIGFSVFF